MCKVSESIFSGKTTVIPMADVCYIQRDKRPSEKEHAPVWIIMKASTWNDNNEDWNNAPFLRGDEAASFLRCWCTYRSELEAETLMDLTPSKVTDLRRPI